MFVNCSTSVRKSSARKSSPMLRQACLIIGPGGPDVFPENSRPLLFAFSEAAVIRRAPRPTSWLRALSEYEKTQLQTCRMAAPDLAVARQDDPPKSRPVSGLQHGFV